MTKGSETSETQGQPFGVELKRYFSGEAYPDYWIHKVRERHGVHWDALHAFLDSLELSEGDLLLELGAGEGMVASEVRKRGAGYVGIDISRMMLTHSKEQIRSSEPDGGKLNLVQSDAESLPFKNGSFSRVGSFASFFFFPNQRRALHELSRVCGSGGLVVLEHRNGLSPLIMKYRFRFWLHFLTAIATDWLRSIGIPPATALASILRRGARVLYGFEAPVQPYAAVSLLWLVLALMTLGFRITKCYGYEINYDRQPNLASGVRAFLSPGIIVVARKKLPADRE